LRCITSSCPLISYSSISLANKVYNLNVLNKEASADLRVKFDALNGAYRTDH
jgi:hypothetical protein